ncbi:MAG: preprotein translocase subunit TatC [Chthonomonadaceae bacterium]|nr:preprotein translocase subunit TatC [Chthonomonadaceae bacterium]
MLGKREKTVNEKRMELTEHLGELRIRIIRAFWYLIVGAIIGYQLFPRFYGMLYRPLSQEMARQNKTRPPIVNAGENKSRYAQGQIPTKSEHDALVNDVNELRQNPPAKPIMSIVFRSFQEPFLVKLKVSMIFGFCLVLPFILWELALFITPAMTPEEQKPLRFLIPLSALLLMGGVTVAYKTMFYAMQWFLSYLDDFPQPAVLMQDPNDYILFFVKMMAAFGIAFQLPVVLMGMAFAGIVTSKGLLKQWRWGIVLGALGGVFTPSNDLISMAMLGVPLTCLYFLSIILVRMVENMKAKAKRKAEGI